MRPNILVLGGDGFVGWPTALRLSRHGFNIILVDNLARRMTDVELGCDSLTPIKHINDRLKIWERISMKS